ncbi:hypothetical protein D3C76_1511830 [compost metagenome]
MRADRLAVDHRFPVALQKPERTRIEAKPVTLGKCLFQARCHEAVDAFDAPQHRAHLLTTAKAVCQGLADLGQLIGRGLA